MSCDNLLSVDVVTADGALIHADEVENADLFWAVRGGGGNFGIVTRFEYRLHPVGPEVMTATVMYPFTAAADVLRAWRRFTESAPDEVSSACILWSVPRIADFPEVLHHQPVILIDALYAGTIDDGARILQPLREITEPIADMSGVGPYIEAQSSFDSFFPARTQRYYWKSLNLQTLDDDLIAAVIEHAAARPSPQTLIVLRHLGGAMGRVPAHATAFGDRSAPFNLSLDATWIDPADDDRNITWTRATWTALNTYSDGSVYLNFPGFQEEGESLTRRQFGANLERLAAIKRKYDPTNFFRLNQNIKPD
jgi:FAD/FMN-containing dehydrogenase